MYIKSCLVLKRKIVVDRNAGKFRLNVKDVGAVMDKMIKSKAVVVIAKSNCPKSKEAKKVKWSKMINSQTFWSS